jgi:hypothetical protein
LRTAQKNLPAPLLPMRRCAARINFHRIGGLKFSLKQGRPFNDFRKASAA